MGRTLVAELINAPDSRRDLRKALSRLGCEDAEAAAVVIEDLVRAG